MKPTSPRFPNPPARLDRQVLALFDKMRIEDDRVRDWFRAVLASKNKDAQADTRAQRAELQRQETMIDVSDRSSRHTPCAVRETVIRRGIQ